jgi:tetratricopeptide (TPR) repeat protein
MSNENVTENTSEYWKDTARTLYLSRRHDEAKAAIERALSIDPRNYDALLFAATILLEMDEDESVILPLYDRAIEVRPDDAEAYAEKAEALANENHHKDALPIARKALELFQEEEDEFTERAEFIYESILGVLYQSGLVDEARELLRKGQARHGFREFVGSYLTHDITD